MASFDKCKKCGNWVWDWKCSCRLFLVCICDWDDEEYARYATDADTAATKEVEDQDRDDCTVLLGEKVTVRVTDVESGEVSTWEVMGETVPEYHATKKGWR